MKKCLACEHCYESNEWLCPNCHKAPTRTGNFFVFAPSLAYENSGFSSDYFKNLASLEENSFWFRSRNRLLWWAIQNYFPKANSFFEIGCGTGYVLRGVSEHFPQLAVSGSEIFLAGLEFAERRLPTACLYQMDARSIPFSEEFDLIGAFDVLEHIEDDQSVLDQMFQACKPGGGIIVTVPQHRFLWSALDDYSFHKRRYSRRELVEKVRRSGFKSLRVTSFVSLLLPLMVLSRMNMRKVPENGDLGTEFEIRPFVSKALEGVMSFERLLIEGGLSLPIGGSLLTVAKKEKA
jgi:SAM-dependent methyltransferase